MTADERVLLWTVVILVLIAIGIGAAVKLFLDNRNAPSHKGAPAAGPADTMELLRVEIDPTSQRLQLWLAGRPARAEDIADEQVRGHVQALMRLLKPEAEESATPATTSAVPPAPPSAPKAEGLAPTPTPSDAPQSIPAPSDQPASAMPAAGEEVSAPFLARLRESLTPPPYNIPPVKVPPRKSPATAPPPASDMFTQINTVLQRRAREQGFKTPLEIIGEEGELHIRYGEQNYLQVDAVPDEHARELIRAAVEEWEAT